MNGNSLFRPLVRATLFAAAALLASACVTTGDEGASSQIPAAGDKYPEHTTGSRVPARR